MMIWLTNVVQNPVFTGLTRKGSDPVGLLEWLKRDYQKKSANTQLWLQTTIAN